MKKLFLFHSIVEMIGGVLLIFRPDLLLMSDGQAVELIIVSKLYGTLALTFGIISFLLYKVFQYSDTFKKIALLIMFFHLMVSFQMYAAYSQGIISNLGAFGLHMLLAVLFFGVYMNELNSFSARKDKAEN